jgi:hypothetical protein
MKKIVYFLLFALCLPIGIFAQSVDDDLYFVPSKDKQEKKETPVKKEPKKQVTTNIYTSPGTTVVVQDRKGRTRDVDEYNRRYDARDNEFVMDNDTLYIKEKSNPDLDGEWVTGEFNGTTDDYEYAERIIRFRNPAFLMIVSIGVESFFAINTTIPRQTNKVIKLRILSLKVGTETTSSLLLGKK